MWNLCCLFGIQTTSGLYWSGLVAGFFSDEPGFYNVDGFDMNDAIGRKKRALPWSDEMQSMMPEIAGKEWQKKLPYLWFNAAGFLILQN